MATIKVTFAPDGSSVSEIEGVKGTGCEALQKLLDRALGATVKASKKPEYYQEGGDPRVHQLNR